MRRRQNPYTRYKREYRHLTEIVRPDTGWDRLHERLMIAADRIAPDRHASWTPSDLPNRTVYAFRNQADRDAFEEWLSDSGALDDQSREDLFEAIVDVPADLDSAVLERLKDAAHRVTLGRYRLTQSDDGLVFGFPALTDAKSFRRRIEELSRCAADTHTT